jgi:hypothetical protein
MEGGAAGENWAAPAAGLAGDEVGKAEGLTCKRFVAGVWVGVAPVMQLRGDWTPCSGEVPVDGVFWYTKHVHYTLVWI